MRGGVRARVVWIYFWIYFEYHIEGREKWEEREDFEFKKTKNYIYFNNIFILMKINIKYV